MKTVISVENLKKTYVTPMTLKKVPVLKGLSFSVEVGKMVGFLGANGAGKTTTLKILLGFVKKYEGHFSILDKQEIGFLTERPYFYEYLTGFEFLTFCSQLFKKKVSVEKINSLLEQVNLAHAAHRPLRNYSKGMLQRIGMAQALVNDPKLLILDEPMSGLDPDGRASILNLMKLAHKNGTTVFFSTHLIADIETHCDQVVIINDGKLVIQSDVQTLLSQFATGFLLEKYQNGKLLETVYPDQSKLQKAIDDARSKDEMITKVSSLRPNLEEVFLKIKRGEF